MSIADFIQQYYINPIRFNEGYNFVNALTYGLFLVIAVYLTFKFLEKRNVKIDRKFAVSIIILVVFGAMVRLLEEAKIIVSYFLVTPLIWMEIFAFIFILYLISKFVEKRFKIPYHRTLSYAGLLLIFLPLALVLNKIIQFKGMIITLALLVPFALILYLIKWRLENKLVTMAHVFDATATFTAVRFFGLAELYPIPRFLVSVSPFSFIAVKIVAIVTILILIDKYSDDKKFNNFLKLIIAILGLGPAIRDFFIVALVS